MKITRFLEFIVLLQFNAITCIRGCNKVSGKKNKICKFRHFKGFYFNCAECRTEQEQLHWKWKKHKRGNWSISIISLRITLKRMSSLNYQFLGISAVLTMGLKNCMKSPQEKMKTSQCSLNFSFSANAEFCTVLLKFLNVMVQLWITLTESVTSLKPFSNKPGLNCGLALRQVKLSGFARILPRIWRSFWIRDELKMKNSDLRQELWVFGSTVVVLAQF